MDVLIKQAKTAEVRHLMGQTNINWDSASGVGDEQSNGKGQLALMDSTGLLFYTGGPGWDGLYHDYKDFPRSYGTYTVFLEAIQRAAAPRLPCLRISALRRMVILTQMRLAGTHSD